MNGLGSLPPNNSAEPLLSVRDVRTWFHTGRGLVRAVDGVSFDLAAGETLGIVGESGSGKSVLSRSILRLVRGSHVAVANGEIRFGGMDLMRLRQRQLRDIRGLRMAIILQDPMTSLNPVVKIGRQITETLTQHLDLSHKVARQRAVELLDSVGISDPARRLNQYPHELSGGMRQRVTIAMAISCEPEVLIADEPTTALDVTVQAQILSLLNELQRDRGMAMIFITHDLGVVAGIADSIAVMYAGQFVERGSADQIVAAYRMPYTQALIESSPRLEYEAHTRLPVIPGRPPDMVNPPLGCRFHPRCAYAGERCSVDEPQLEPAGPGHHFACWYPVAPGAASEPGLHALSEEGLSDGR